MTVFIMQLYGYVCPLFQCELYHWVDVLDRFDEILEEAATNQADPSLAAPDLSQSTSSPSDCIYMCPKLSDREVWWLNIVIMSTAL